MPAIFTPEHRDELHLRMVEAGWRALCAGGVRALRVEEIARAAGIAKGTFYHFFPSKGAFIYAMLMENRQRAVDMLDEMHRQAERRLGRDALRGWLERIWGSDRNIFRIATAEEYAYLARGFPRGRSLDPAVDGKLVDWVVDEIADARAGVDRHAAQNLQKTLALVLLNRGILHADALERTVAALIDATLDELFG